MTDPATTAPVSSPPATPPEIRELVITLFELGREITSVLNLDELLHKIPQLIARITKFQAFAVYLLDPREEELRIAYAVGYPDDVVWGLRVKVGHGLVGAAVQEGKPILVNDVHADPRYVDVGSPVRGRSVSESADFAVSTATLLATTVRAFGLYAVFFRARGLSIVHTV